jgi:hypothetical protein
MQRVVRLDTDRGERGLLFAGQVLVEKGERDARAIVGERFGAHAPDFFLVSRFSGSRGDVTEHLPASVLDHALCHVEGVGQHAPDMAIVIRNRAVRKREVALLEVVVAAEREELVAQGAHGLALFEGRVESRARSDSGQCSTGPRSVVDQSKARIRGPMPPPPANTDSINCFWLRPMAVRARSDRHHTHVTCSHLGGGSLMARQARENSGRQLAPDGPSKYAGQSGEGARL